MDPFSSESANKIVGAKKIFTENDSGINKKWSQLKANVWMNPPYGRGLINDAIKTFIDNLPNIKQGIILVNNATETLWFQSLLEYASAICIVKGRIAFDSPDGKAVSGNTRGQVFLYFGSNLKSFKKVFSKIGIVLCQ